MDLHYKLRQGTKELHAQIERTPHIKKIIKGNISLEEYQCLLELFYGYIEPCERLIFSSSFNQVLVNREKSLLLENDLLALGVHHDTHKKTLQCANLPMITKIEHALGYLYVIEGSTLGGQMIAKILSNKLNLTSANGASYFNGYGGNTRAMWDEFCKIINSINTTQQQKIIIDSASLTYATLINWFGNYHVS